MNESRVLVPPPKEGIAKFFFGVTRREKRVDGERAGECTHPYKRKIGNEARKEREESE